MTFKVALLGDGGVGKTSLRRRYLGESFPTNYMITIGADFSATEMTIDGKAFKFQIWDLAGQKHFSIIRPMYLKGAVGALVVFDASRRETAENIFQWVEDLWKYDDFSAKVPIVLVCNKIDLRSIYPDAITTEEGLSYAEKLTSLFDWEYSVPYIETSAKMGQNVNQAFLELGKAVISYIKNFS